VGRGQKGEGRRIGDRGGVGRERKRGRIRSWNREGEKDRKRPSSFVERTPKRVKKGRKTRQEESPEKKEIHFEGNLLAPA